MNSALAASVIVASIFSLSFWSSRGRDSSRGDAQVSQLKPLVRQAAAEIAPASDEAERALQRIKAPEGFKVSLWAAEPMLANPVAFNFDEHGRMFVAETHRYRSSVLDIRDYLWTLEDELANRNLGDNEAGILRHFGPKGVKQLSVESERVRLLEDTDHDGKADRASVFAEGFNSPLDGIAAGVLARRGKVYLTSIPSLWLLEQENGAGVATKRTELSRGYGIRFNITGHDLHAPVFGPDGKIYFSIGDRAAHATAIDGTVVDNPDSGAVFRCNPDGSQLEIFATGLRNPQSLFFNEYGDLFTGDNDSDLGDRERLVHVVEGGDSGWRIGYQYAPLGQTGVWNLEKLWQPRFREQATYLLPPAGNIEDGPSGIAYYPGTGLSERFRGGIFISHFKGGSATSGIYLYKVKPEGASYTLVETSPFLSSALPTDVKFGPDGKLYYSDWSDGWEKSKKGRIYAIEETARRDDPLVEETRRLIASDFTQKTDDELARLLAHPDWRVRLEAQYTLAERGAKNVPRLADVASARTSVAMDSPRVTSSGFATDPSLLARLHALWALGQIAESAPAALDAIRALARDAQPEVRAQAIKVLGERRDKTSIGILVAALQDESDRVKFFAAQSLAKTGAQSPAPIIAALGANDDRDAFVRHALVMALAKSGTPEAIAAATSDTSSAVRLGAVLALRRAGSPLVARFLDDRDPLIVAEAARAINDTPINAALSDLAALIAHPPAFTLTQSGTNAATEMRRASSFTRDRPPALSARDTLMVRVLNANFRLGSAEHAAAISRYAARPDVSVPLRIEALAELAEWAAPLPRDRVVGVYRPLTPATRDRAVAVAALRPLLPQLLAKSTPAPVQAATIATIEKLQIDGAGDLLFAVVAGNDWAGPVRSQALVTLSRFKHWRLPEAVRVAERSSSATLRVAAIPFSSKAAPAAIASLIAKLEGDGDVPGKKAALETLGLMRQREADVAIAAQLRRLQRGEVEPEVQLELVEAAEKRSDDTVGKLLGEFKTRAEKDADPLAPFLVALRGGDAERGRKIFREHPVAACIRCHQVDGEGGAAGPNLSDVAARHPREYLLESVVRPNAKIAAGFQGVLLTLADGGVQAGAVTAEDSGTLTLRRADNSVVRIVKSEIAKQESAPSSMPDIFGQVLTRAELRDVVEYLASLRAASAQQAIAHGAGTEAFRTDPRGLQAGLTDE